MSLPPLPWTTRGNRVYAADGEETIVATRSSPKYRKHADTTAATVTATMNALDRCRVCDRLFGPDKGRIFWPTWNGGGPAATCYGDPDSLQCVPVGTVLASRTPPA